LLFHTPLRRADGRTWSTVKRQGARFNVKPQRRWISFGDRRSITNQVMRIPPHPTVPVSVEFGAGHAQPSVCVCFDNRGFGRRCMGVRWSISQIRLEGSQLSNSTVCVQSGRLLPAIHRLTAAHLILNALSEFPFVPSSFMCHLPRMPDERTAATIGPRLTGGAFLSRFDRRRDARGP
jgi:hypothetical protein